MIGIGYAIIIAFLLVAATVVIHYEVLRLTSRMIPKLPMNSVRGPMLLVMTGIFIAHLLQISLYAGAYYLMENHWDLGDLEGELEIGGAYLDYFYFSLTSYTTLGIGDVRPEGPIRIVVGMEGLNGFVLIGWSASFTFLAMQRLWRETRDADVEDMLDR